MTNKEFIISRLQDLQFSTQLKFCFDDTPNLKTITELNKRGEWIGLHLQAKTYKGLADKLQAYCIGLKRGRKYEFYNRDYKPSK